MTIFRSKNEPKSRKIVRREPIRLPRTNQKKQFSRLTKISTNPVYNSLNYGQNCWWRQYKLWIKLLVSQKENRTNIYVLTSQKTKAPNSNNLLTILP